MSKNKTAKSTLASTSNLEAEIMEAQVAAESSTKQTAAPVIKETPVEERQYELVLAAKEADTKFRGKQRQIVYDILKVAEQPMTIAEVAKLADGLVAKGGVEPSVRYHLHHMTKDGVTLVVNPTITLV